MSGALPSTKRQAVVERISAEADHGEVVNVYPTPCRGCARPEVLLQALRLLLQEPLLRRTDTRFESTIDVYTSIVDMNNTLRDLPNLPCMCASFRRASRALTQLYDEALRPVGLRATQFTILQALSLTGEVSQGELAQILAMDSTTLTRTLRIMQAQLGRQLGDKRWHALMKLTNEVTTLVTTQGGLS